MLFITLLLIYKQYKKQKTDYAYKTHNQTAITVVLISGFSMIIDFFILYRIVFAIWTKPTIW